MKVLIIHLDAAQLYYTLPDGMTGEDFKRFKRDYIYFIDAKVSEGRRKDKHSVTLDIDSLPCLIDNFDALKTFMTDDSNPHYTVEDWNTQRQLAKGYFTAPCIMELDASGFIKKLVKK